MKTPLSVNPTINPLYEAKLIDKKGRTVCSVVDAKEAYEIQAAVNQHIDLIHENAYLKLELELIKKENEILIKKHKEMEAKLNEFEDDRK